MPNKIKTGIILHCVWDTAIVYTVHENGAGTQQSSAHISVITGYEAYNFKEHPH